MTTNMREALEAARSFVEMAYQNEDGEEAQDAKFVLDQIDAALSTPQPDEARLREITPNPFDWKKPENIDKHPERYTALESAIEGVILARLHENKIEGHVLEMSVQIAEVARRIADRIEALEAAQPAVSDEDEELIAEIHCRIEQAKAQGNHFPPISVAFLAKCAAALSKDKP